MLHTEDKRAASFSSNTLISVFHPTSADGDCRISIHPSVVREPRENLYRRMWIRTMTLAVCRYSVISVPRCRRGRAVDVAL